MEDTITKKPRLPAELLKEIFVQVKDKKDLKNCLLVCKSWFYTIQAFFSQDIRIKMNDRSINKLYKDLQASPGFGQKVKYITFNQLSSGAELPTRLRNALNLCPNLLELQFDITDVYEYLKAMNCHEMVLPSIQKIRIPDLNACSPAVRRFHLWVNYRFRTTITSLEIADLEDNGALKNYGGLIKLVAQFPNLTYLRAKCHSHAERQLNVDLTALLQVCPKLQELKLYSIGKIINHIKDIPESEPTEFTNLTKLKLKVSQISIKSLQYITARFKNVNNLRLISYDVTPDNSLTTTEATAILNEFKAYYESFKRLNVNYKYKTQNFSFNNGKKRPWNPNNIMMFMGGLPEEFLLHDDWMDDDDFDFEDGDFIDDEGFLDHEDFIGELATDTLDNMLYEAHLASMLYQHHLDTHVHEDDDIMDQEEEHELDHGTVDHLFNDDSVPDHHQGLNEDFIRGYYSL